MIVRLSGSSVEVGVGGARRRYGEQEEAKEGWVEGGMP